MCGIIGFLKSKIKSESVLKDTKVLSHRGPDDNGIYEDSNIFLAHNRLAIIDLKDAIQPMSTKDGRFTIVFNGEIYNYYNLKKQLIDKNYQFITKSDTEVLLYMYVEYKEKIVDLLDGMFSFGIWDSYEKKLFLARDHIGIKPLYYVNENNKFAFASEIKALKPFIKKKKINNNAIYDYFKFGYVSKGQTIYNEIQELKPGSYGVYTDNKLIIKKYWKPEFGQLLSITANEASEMTQYLLNQSVKKRLMSDVPFGLFLSGGLDSSFILSEMSKHLGKGVPAFTIGFEDNKFNEIEYAKETAKCFDADLKSYVFSENDLLENLELIVSHMDQPHSDPAIIPTFLLSQLASKDVKMVLSGEGGDELFFGYQRYRSYLFTSIFPKISFLKKNIKCFDRSMIGINDKLRVIFKLCNSISFSQYQKYYTWIATGEIWENIIDSQLVSNFENSSLNKELISLFQNEKLGAARKFDFLNYLPSQLLKKVDMSTMQYGLEARVPFLDRDLVEYTFKIPINLHINIFKQKILLREILKNNLPEAIIRRRKKGFSLPLNTWFRKGLKYKFEEHVLSNINPLFNSDKVIEYYNLHQNGDINIGKTLWNILIFHIWFVFDQVKL